MIYLFMFLLVAQLLEMQRRTAIFLHFSNKSHSFVVSQIICLPEKFKKRMSSILVHIMNLLHKQNIIN